jgi:CubicO group peptidase (beta-lactamase class C family)
LRGFVSRCLAAVVFAGLAFSTNANTRALPPTPSPAEVEAFFDGLVPHALSRAGIPGGAVSVVKDGQILFAKGYGYANLAERRPVRADETLFRLGSVSKLFTWTAVMQLVEQGKLDLDADVNGYLDFKIPDAFGAPITLKHLLTHAAGFEEMVAGVGYTEAERLVPEGQHLHRYLPRRIYAPGQRIAYSNYGCALAGYIVERISGEPFAEYMRAHILAPLQMSHATFEQPLPQSLAAAMSESYDSISRTEPSPFIYVQIAPAGALSATITDMSRFVIAHLQDGQFEDARILRPETAALMHQQHYPVAPGSNGYTYGFWELHRNGWRMIGHSGDVGYFHASLYLVPQAGYGIVVQLNGTGEPGRKLGSDVVRWEIVDEFMDRYLPGAPAEEPTAATQLADAKRVVGRYQSTRHNESTLKFMAVVNADDEITSLSDGMIEISSRLQPSGAPKRWREIGPLVYREVNGQSRLFFATDKQGEVLYWVSEDYPPAMVFERLGGLRGLGLLQPLFFLSCITILIVVARVGISAIPRRFSSRLVAPAAGKSTQRTLSRTAYGVQLIILLAWSVFVITELGGYAAGGSIMPLYVMRVLSVLGLVAAVPPLVYAVLRVRTNVSGLQKIGECVAALASLFIAWFLATHTL